MEEKIVNPYLLQLLKCTIIGCIKGSVTERLDEGDLLDLENLTGISVNTLKRFIFTESRDARYKFSTNYLDKLCRGLPKHCVYWGDWKNFQLKEGNKEIAYEAALLRVRLQELGYDRKSAKDTDLKKRIIDCASKRAHQVINNITPSNIPIGDKINDIRPATGTDIHDIYSFALEGYDGCDLNGPEIKVPWWKKNPLIFYVYFNSKRVLKANINLLPLKPECYNEMKRGQILEKEITSSDIYSLDEKHLVKYIYCEGLNIADDIYLRVIGNEFENMIQGLCENTEALIIGSFGGTKDGDHLMGERLGFDVASTGVNGKEFYKFYEIPYNVLLENCRPLNEKIIGSYLNIGQ